MPTFFPYESIRRIEETMSSHADHDDALHRIRHSLAHVMAQAVMKIRPGTKLGFGPAIDDGFYYDFILPAPITEEDFPAIEKEMRKIIGANQKFEQEELPNADARARIDGMGEPYKREYVEELIAKKGLTTIGFYKNGPFLDMCEGPHVSSTKDIPPDAFKLRSVAGAYWRGDSKNVMMTRLYAWAYKNKEELVAHIKAHEDALARDHKKLGKELDIFTIDERAGKGLPLWLPNGTVIRDELEKLMRELEFQDGYVRVVTPVLARKELYEQTGHLPYYAVHMYPFMELKDRHGDAKPEGEPAPGATGAADQQHPEHVETYCLRPMNCPHHHMVFDATKRSYRELPLRLAEYGNVYRYEDSGAVSGLLRVRGMCMNDAHIYCTRDQIEAEFEKVIAMHKRVYEILGIDNYSMRFSTKGEGANKEKFVDNPEAWADTENIVRGVLDKTGMPYTVGEGEAAFYGPKIDFQFKSVTGREETASTVQLDFAVPARLNLKYVGSDNADHMPYVIHRAPAGTHERFVAFLLERYGGAFPTWIAPVQVRVLPVGGQFVDYANKLAASLRQNFVRAEVDDSNDSFNKKIRNGTMRKIPNLLVVGAKEESENAVTLRRYGVQEQKTMPFAEFQAWVLEQIKTRDRGGR